MTNKRPDRIGALRTEFDKNKRRILQTQDICGICGKPVDKSLKFPHPLSPTIDHIIPIDRGGHPSALDNLQLAHFCCNRQKSNGIKNQKQEGNNHSSAEAISNRVLPWSTDWATYRAQN